MFPKSLLAVAAALLVVGGGVAATGVAQTDTDTSRVSALDMDATLDAETVAVTVTDEGAPVENASVTVEGEEEVTATTDANGTATVPRSALTEGNESLNELEVAFESDHAEGTLEFVVQDGSPTLVEETYEYDVEAASDEGDDEDESEERDDDEAESDDDEDDESDDDEDDESDDDEDDEAGE